MREIKFRAKRIDMDRWIYGQYFTTPLTDENSGTTPDKGWYFLTGEPRHCIVQNMVAFVIDPRTLGQFTGLKDKNGKEIYEGDIVDLDGFDSHGDFGEYKVEFKGTFKVEWRDDLAGFDLCKINANVDGWCLMEDSRHDLTIIGNIHSNPELLNG